MNPAGGFTIPAGHPSLAGHFPGQPIVPGVLLLAETFALLRAAYPGFAVTGLEQAKFLRPVSPGEMVAVTSHLMETGRAHFTGMIGAQVVLRGVAHLAPA